MLYKLWITATFLIGSMISMHFGGLYYKEGLVPILMASAGGLTLMFGAIMMGVEDCLKDDRKKR